MSGRYWLLWGVLTLGNVALLLYGLLLYGRAKLMLDEAQRRIRVVIEAKNSPDGRVIADALDKYRAQGGRVR